MKVITDLNELKISNKSSYYIIHETKKSYLSSMILSMLISVCTIIEVISLINSLFYITLIHLLFIPC